MYACSRAASSATNANFAWLIAAAHCAWALPISTIASACEHASPTPAACSEAGAAHPGRRAIKVRTALAVTAAQRTSRRFTAKSVSATSRCACACACAASSASFATCQP